MQEWKKNGITWMRFACILLRLHFFLTSSYQLRRLVEVGSWDVQGLPLLAQPAPKHSYSPMAGKPAPSSHEPPRHRNQAPVTLIDQWKNKGGRDGGKRMIQRLNKESGRQEDAELSTWK